MSSVEEFLDTLQEQVEELRNTWKFRNHIWSQNIYGIIRSIKINLNTMYENLDKLNADEIDRLNRIRNSCSPVYESFKSFYNKEDDWGDLPPYG